VLECNLTPVRFTEGHHTKSENTLIALHDNRKQTIIKKVIYYKVSSQHSSDKTNCSVIKVHVYLSCCYVIGRPIARKVFVQVRKLAQGAMLQSRLSARISVNKENGSFERRGYTQAAVEPAATHFPL
jgi:hypothetical protein